jgi:hypothetical protein
MTASVHDPHEQNPPGGDGRPRAAGSRWRPGCLLVPLAVILVLLLLDMAAMVFGHRALDRQIQALSNQGRRISSAGMMPACSESDNAGPLWEQALASYNHSNPTAAEAMNRRAGKNWPSLTAEDKQAMREHFSASAAVVPVMQEAASRPCFTFAPDYTEPMSAWDSPRMTGVAKLASELIVYRGHLALDDGSTSEAIDCVVLGAEMARSYARLPSFVAALLSRLILSRAMELGELVLPNTPVPDGLAQRMIKALDPAIYRKALADGLDGERVMLLEMTTYALSFSAPPMSWGPSTPSLRPVAAIRDALMGLVARPIVASDGAVIQEVMARASDLALKEPWEAGAQHDELDATLAGLPRWRFFARSMLPRVKGIRERSEDTLPRAQIMRTALACKQYRTAHGSLPESTQQLVPDYLKSVPTDPYTGKPMSYVRLASGGFAIYSVGADGKDGTKLLIDAGTLETSATRARPRTNDDFVWVESGNGAR